MVTKRRVFLTVAAVAAVALSASAAHGQNAPAPTAPRSPDGQPTPAYPQMLARSGVEGEVWLRVAVDSLGHPVPSELRVLRSTHDLFARAARAAVLAWRFEPGSGSTEVRIAFDFVDERGDRGRCDAVLDAARDPALAPSWYRYDRATASARVTVCLPPTRTNTVVP
jgi:TonB family protein